MRKTLKRFMSYYKPYKGLFIADMLCVILLSIAGLAFPVAIRYMTKTVFYMEDSSLMMELILKISGVMIILYLVEAAAQYFVTSWGHIMGAKIETDMRSQLFTHMEKLSFSFYDQNNTGRLASRLLADLFDITELAHHGPENLFMALIKIVGAFIILLQIHIPTTLILILCTLLMIIFSSYYNKLMHQTFMENRSKIADINAVVQDSLSGIRTVQSFSNEEIEHQKFQKSNTAFLHSKKKNYLVMGRYHSVNGFIQGMLYIVIMVAGGFFVSRGELDAADIITYILYIGMFLDPIKRLINFNEQFQKGITGFERVVRILDTEPEIKDRPDAVSVGPLDGQVSFKQVSFAYANDEPVLADLDLEIGAKQTIALVGPSGSGKSTFVSLLPRFYEVSAGSVQIDGIDVRDMTMKSLRENIGVVQQDVYIFNSSVRDNIAYGKPEASNAEIIEAAKLANIHDFIMSLPEGYNTMLGERGVRFSGGQKQRISIARVFLKNPPILILDEATSALDNESEVLIQKALDKLSKDRTTFVIAHRLSTIQTADEILVLTDDGVVERGSHRDLLELGGVYKHLHDLQFRLQAS